MHPQGKLQKIDDAFKTEFAEAYDYFAKRGRRVLGFAYKTFTDDTNMVFDEEKGNFPTTDLVFVGLSAIVDPPRGGVREAIERCHTANIKVFMVTGDHSLTAEAIARQVRSLGYFVWCSENVKWRQAIQVLNRRTTVHWFFVYVGCLFFYGVVSLRYTWEEL